MNGEAEFISFAPPTPAEPSVAIPPLIHGRNFAARTVISDADLSPLESGVDHSFEVGSAVRRRRRRRRAAREYHSPDEQSIQATSSDENDAGDGDHRRHFPSSLAFWNDPSLDWSGDEWKSRGWLMRYNRSAVEGEYTRWLRGSTRRAVVMPAAAHLLIFISLAIGNAVLATDSRRFTYGSSLAALAAVLVSVLDSFCASRFVMRRRWALRGLAAASHPPADATPCDYAAARSSAARSEAVFGVCITVTNVLVILVNYGAPRTGFMSKCVDEHARVPYESYFLSTLPPLYLAGHVLLYNLRFCFTAMATVLYFGACVLGSYLWPGDVTDDRLRWNMLLCMFGILAGIAMLGRVTESLLRERFEHVISAQCSLRTWRVHESSLWAIVRGVVPEPLLPRVRAAVSLENLVLLDHSATAAVAVATFPSFGDWARHMLPSETVTTVFRIFATFDRVLRDHNANAFGIAKLIATGDMYIVCGGLLCRGRAKPRLYGSMVVMTAGESGSDVLDPDRELRGSFDVTARMLSIALDQVNGVRGCIRAPQRTHGVVVGVAYGEAWGGLNGEILHHRYLLHGSALNRALAAGRFAGSDEVAVDDSVYEALVQSDIGNHFATARLLLRTYRYVPTASPRVKRVRIATASADDVAAVTRASATSLSAEPSQRTTADESTPQEGGESLFDVLPSADDQRDLDAAAADGRAPPQDNPLQRTGSATSSPHPTAGPRMPSAGAGVQGRRTGSTAERIGHADRATAEAIEMSVARQARARGGVLEHPQSEAAFHEFCRVVDRRSAATVLLAMVTLGTAMGVVFVLDRTTNRDALGAPEPYLHAPWDIATAVFGVLFMAASVSEFVGTVASVQVPGAALWFTSTISIFTGAASQACGRYSILGRLTLLNTAIGAVLVLLRATRVHFGVKTATYVVATALGYVIELAAVGATAARIRKEWLGVFQFVGGAVLFGFIAYRRALFVRHVFMTALLSQEWLQKVRARVSIREQLLRGLVPPHLVQRVAAAVFDAEEEAALQARLSLGDLRGALVRPPALASLQRSVFDAQPRFIEHWDHLCAASIRCHFQLALEEPTAGMRCETSATRRALRDALDLIRAIDQVAAAVSSRLRVIHITGDVVTVVAFPASPSRMDGASCPPNVGPSYPSATRAAPLAQTTATVAGDDDGAASLPAEQHTTNAANADATLPLDRLEEDSPLPDYPVTDMLLFLQRLIGRTPCPVTAHVVCGHGFGTVCGDVVQHVVLGDAVRLADVLAASVTPPTAFPNGGDPYQDSRGWATAIVKRRFVEEVAQQRSRGTAAETPKASCVDSSRPTRTRVAEFGPVMLFPLLLQSETQTQP